MTERIAGISPRSKARITGAVYLFYFLTAISAQLLVNHGFARYGLAVNLIATAFYVALTLLLYYLFKPVNKSLSLLAALLSLGGCAITALNLFRLAAQVSPLLFFGPYCLLIGYLILRSAFLPRIVGGLMVIAGLSWLTYLSNPLVNYLSPYNLACGFLGEAAVFLWLLVMSVNVPKRKKKQEFGELAEPSQRLVSAIPLTDGHQEKVDQQPPPITRAVV